MYNVVAIHQPNYMPWPGFFNKIFNANVFVILDTVDFQTGNASSLTNRAKIKSPQGELLLTQPVKKGNSKVIKDIILDNNQPWRKKQLASIQMNYKKATAFSEVFPLIESVFAENEESMSVCNTKLLKAFCDYLNITTPLVYASTLPEYSDDKNLRLIEICKHFGATVYLSGTGARKYNDHDLYKQHGLEIKYNEYDVKPYPQLYGQFIPYLSVADTLFNMGKEAINVIKQNN